MWYKISDSPEGVSFFVNCSLEHARVFLTNKKKETNRYLKLMPCINKPDGLVVSGCSRVNNNVFIEVFVLGQKK